MAVQRPGKSCLIIARRQTVSWALSIKHNTINDTQIYEDRDDYQLVGRNTHIHTNAKTCAKMYIINSKQGYYICKCMHFPLCLKLCIQHSSSRRNKKKNAGRQVVPGLSLRAYFNSPYGLRTLNDGLNNVVSNLLPIILMDVEGKDNLTWARLSILPVLPHHVLQVNGSCIMRVTTDF